MPRQVTAIADTLIRRIAKCTLSPVLTMAVCKMTVSIAVQPGRRNSLNAIGLCLRAPRRLDLARPVLLIIAIDRTPPCRVGPVCRRQPRQQTKETKPCHAAMERDLPRAAHGDEAKWEALPREGPAVFVYAPSADTTSPIWPDNPAISNRVRNAGPQWPAARATRFWM